MPSLIHTSRQSRGVTWSPHQWCTVSCTSTGSDMAYSWMPRVIIVWVSMPLVESTNRKPSESNG